MTLLAVLIALGLILNLFSIPIPAFGIDLSFAWLPTMVIGWIFGPVVGCLLGIIVDNLNFLIHGGVWFYLYAIQQPMLAFIAGFVGSLFRLAKQLNWHFLINVIINQLFIFAFIAVSIFIMFAYTNPDSKAFQHLVKSGRMSVKVNEIFRWVILAAMILFAALIEGITIYQYYRWKQHKNNLKFTLFLYSSIICILSTIIFSFILGPVSAIKYFEFMYGRTPTSLFKYGVVYYLLPRVLKECVKTPIYIILFLSVLMVALPIVEHIQNTAKNTYKYESEKSSLFKRMKKQKQVILVTPLPKKPEPENTGFDLKLLPSCQKQKATNNCNKTV
ncbi:ECF transporter S component [Ureaplasma sp. OM1]|uniref:ECF transporter S component n=2 Tax=Ureaplasma ceti TaxID=3119530 RepID=A0ABP9UBL7_9BACT